MTEFTIIKASAGSGKTYTITELIAQLFSSTGKDSLGDSELAHVSASIAHALQGIKPSNIIATTFTNAAAAEMKARIRTTLLSKGLTKQAEDIDTALIGTVNAIFSRLVTDYAIEQGISPDVRILDEQAATDAFTAACGKVISDAYSENAVILRRFSYIRGESENNRHGSPQLIFSSVVKKLVDKARSNDMSPTDLEQMKKRTIEEFDSTLRKLADKHDIAIKPARPDGSIVDILVECLTAISAEAEEVSSYFEETKKAPPGVNKTSAKNMSSRVEKIQDLIDDLGRPTSFTYGDWLGSLSKTLGKSTFFDDIRHRLHTDQLIWCNEYFIADGSQVIATVFDTAARCLDVYAEAKKALGLLDFTDQEHIALQLLRTSEKVREDIKTSYRLLVVDEFQDTTPLQLALFMEVAQLVEQVIWVGDPKQSIYGFRDSDADLMDAVMDSLSDESTRKTSLKYSWRLKKRLVTFTNELFAASMGDESLRLEVPPEKASTDCPGRVVLVNTHVRGVSKRARAMADILVEDEKRKERTGVTGPVSRAVLRRSKPEDLVADFANAGFTCAGDSVSLLSTREALLIRAGLTAAIDPTDSLAIMELVSLIPEHPAHDTWFSKLANVEIAPEQASGDPSQDAHARLRARRRACSNLVDTWFRDDVFADLRRLSTQLGQLSPVEAIKAVAQALDLDRRIAGWTHPNTRLETITQLVRIAARYEDTCSASRTPATLSGLAAQLMAGEGDGHRAEPTTDPATLHIGTIHGAKGLGWDEVVYFVDAPRKPSSGGLWVRPADHFELTNPLAGRELRYWPVFNFADCDMQELETTTALSARYASECAENQRLAYVAMTRAKDTLYVCLPSNSYGKSAPSLFESTFRTPANPSPFLATSGMPDITLGFADGDSPTTNASSEDARSQDAAGRDSLLTVYGSGNTHLADIPVEKIIVTPDMLEAREPLKTSHAPSPGSAQLIDAAPNLRTGSVEPLPAHFAPSSATAGPDLIEKAHITRAATLGTRLGGKGDRRWDLVGDCIHAYLASPLPHLDEPERLRIAARLVEGYGVSSLVTPATLLECGDRLTRWIQATYPGSRVMTEVPFSWANEQHQRAQGWFDALIETSDGNTIVVDHKSYPGKNPQGHIRNNYLGQMDIYRKAVEEVTGKAPIAILIHLPLLGEVYEISGFGDPVTGSADAAEAPNTLF